MSIFSFLSKRKNRIPDYPSLKVLSGQTVDLAGGGVYRYVDVEVESGGTLRITGEAGGWTEILCARDMILNGTILCRAGYDGGSTHGTGTFTKTSELGLGALSYSITQRSGNAGAKGADASGGLRGGYGGAQSNGSGGGGGGGARPDPMGYDGENGGSGNGTLRGNGANGGSEYGGNGASRGGNGTGGGGGGGYKGHHGKGLAILIERNFSGSGSINVSGRDGFNGGSGNGNGRSGGGGAGGSGGRLVFRRKNVLVPTVLYSGGSGGTGNGTAQSGDNGSIDVGLL